MKYIYTLLITALLTSTAIGQTIGDIILKNTTSNETITMRSYSSAKALVIIFTSNVCPYSVYYEGRITQLVADYEGKGIQFVLVNSHTEDKESEDEMANKISTWGLNVPYLADKDKKLQRVLGARKSPEAFIMKPNGSGFKVYFKGAIDNNPQVASDVKEQYLRNNIENLLAGKPASSAGSRPIGCMIK